MHTSYKARITGNALFLILVAVALFAALSYAITQSGRGSGTIDKEMAQLNAAQVVQYTSKIQQAVMRLMLANGCSETDISFEHAAWPAGEYDNPFSPIDESCHVFSPSGGGIAFETPPANVNDPTYSNYEFNGRNLIWGQGVTDISSLPLYPELAAYLRGVTDEHCLAINKGAGLSGIPLDGGSLVERKDFEGVYATAWAGGAAGADSINGCPDASPCATVAESPLKGHPYGCFEEEATGENIFYNVLIPR